MLGALAEFRSAQEEYEGLMSQRAASRDPTRRWLEGKAPCVSPHRICTKADRRCTKLMQCLLMAGVLEKPASAAGEARAIGAMVRELQAVLDTHAVPVRLEPTRVPRQFRVVPSGAVLNLKRQQGELLGRCGGGYESVMKLLGCKIRVPQ